MPMSRKIREQLPGAAFHIVARTQGKAGWFKKAIRDDIEKIIVEGVTSSDAMLMAYAVMPNHFHIMLRQGQRPLGWVMQPVMRRLALLVQRHRQMKGHVFERTFRSRLCDRPRFLRRSVVYTHLNPARARLCDEITSYPWSSHVRYVIESGSVAAVEVAHVLQLFADKPGQSHAELSRNYINYARWRLEKDRCKKAGLIYTVPEPLMSEGDDYFYEFFAGTPMTHPARKMDLRDRAIIALRHIDATIKIDELRTRYMSRAKRETRRQVIAALLTARYPGYAIADFFKVSDTLVSAVAKSLRLSGLYTNGN
jgi:REP element-mobilizing transposase RayT